MKKFRLILLLVPFFFLSTHSFGQNELEEIMEIDIDAFRATSDSAIQALEAFTEMFTADIIFDLPDKDFVKTGNTYVNEKRSAFVMCMLVPQTMEEAKKQFNLPNEEDDEMRLISKKVLVWKGREVLYEENEFFDEDSNQSFNMRVYGLPANDRLILVSAAFPIKEKKYLASRIEKSVKKIKLGE